MTRRFYAPRQNISDSAITLDIDETRHLRDVLRLEIGDDVNVFDGHGNEFECTIASIGKNETQLTVSRRAEPSAPESSLDLTLAVCQLPGDKFDLVVQKAVELGINNLVPLQSVHTERRDVGSANRLERWRKIALGAAKQSGRATLMSVPEPLKFDEFVRSAAAGETVFFFAERDGTSLPSRPPGKKITAIVGPKGGWEDSEIGLARERGFAIVTFGGRILRAETAAISVASILQHRFGDLN